MNRSESKYFATAAKMDEAFLAILEKKDFAYITVKEICEAANVNRSTFYLHYENIGDLLSESVEYMNRQFLDYMLGTNDGFVAKLKNCPIEELYLITPEYLMPYLSYIKEHQRMFCTILENSAALRLNDIYTNLLQYVLFPIMERYKIPEQDRTYMMVFYINGLMAIITEWLKNNCSDPIEQMITVMQKCVMGNQNKRETEAVKENEYKKKNSYNV